jgi:hypothetical protein
MKKIVFITLFLLFSYSIKAQKIKYDSVYFNKKSNLIEYHFNLVYFGYLGGKTYFWGFEHRIGYQHYIKPRYSLRLASRYMYIEGTDEFPLYVSGITFQVGHQYQLFKRRRSPFYVSQLFIYSLFKEKEVSEPSHVLGTTFLFGFSSPLFEKWGSEKWYINLEGGYTFANNTLFPDDKIRITGSPFNFGIQYFFNRNKYEKIKKKKD